MCYFEDINLEETVEVGSYTVTEEEIITFAEQFDPQPFHVDAEAARESLFGGLVGASISISCSNVVIVVTPSSEQSRIHTSSAMWPQQRTWTSKFDYHYIDLQNNKVVVIYANTRMPTNLLFLPIHDLV